MYYSKYDTKLRRICQINQICIAIPLGNKNFNKYNLIFMLKYRWYKNLYTEI